MTLEDDNIYNQSITGVSITTPTLNPDLDSLKAALDEASGNITDTELILWLYNTTYGPDEYDTMDDVSHIIGLRGGQKSVFFISTDRYKDVYGSPNHIYFNNNDWLYCDLPDRWVVNKDDGEGTQDRIDITGTESSYTFDGLFDNINGIRIRFGSHKTFENIKACLSAIEKAFNCTITYEDIANE